MSSVFAPAERGTASVVELLLVAVLVFFVICFSKVESLDPLYWFQSIDRHTLSFSSRFLFPVLLLSVAWDPPFFPSLSLCVVGGGQLVGWGDGGDDAKRKY